MAVRCWCLKFQLSDHMFLHKSHVFSNISKILSRSDEGWGAPVVDPSSKPAVSGFVGAQGGSVGGCFFPGIRKLLRTIFNNLIVWVSVKG